MKNSPASFAEYSEIESEKYGPLPWLGTFLLWGIYRQVCYTGIHNRNRGYINTRGQKTLLLFCIRGRGEQRLIIYGMSPDQRAQFELNMSRFLRNEVEMGITFAHLALDKTAEDARQRNRQNARKAYDTANHFLNEHAVRGSVTEPDILTGLTALRHLLLQLGEKFGDEPHD